MGRRGPRPIPSNLRVIQGNLSGKNPVNKNEPQPAIAPVCPPPPSWLTGYARECWNDTAPALWQIGSLTEIDTLQFASYCEVQGLYRQAVEDLKRCAEQDQETHGVLIRNGSGTLVQNPLLNVVNSLRRDALRLACEFGLTPSSRTAIAAIDRGPGPGTNPFAAKYGLR